MCSIVELVVLQPAKEERHSQLGVAQERAKLARVFDEAYGTYGVPMGVSTPKEDTQVGMLPSSHALLVVQWTWNDYLGGTEPVEKGGRQTAWHMKRCRANSNCQQQCFATGYHNRFLLAHTIAPRARSTAARQSGYTSARKRPGKGPRLRKLQPRNGYELRGTGVKVCSESFPFQRRGVHLLSRLIELNKVSRKVAVQKRQRRDVTKRSTQTEPDRIL
jgi:hypothetical protein